MPVIYVYGVPDKIDRTDLEILCDSLRLGAAAIRELGITKDQVTVFFPRDFIQKGLGEEIIIEVRGLFEKPDRTEEVRKRLAAKLVSACDTFFSPYAKDLGLKLVECFIQPFNPSNGFCTLTITG